ncbi:hypothetical protein WH43_02210 [Rheinheimera sp. KL1]|nr:hypothetical protein WH43_02210 [Rheinheimera sp. KL1]
MPLVPILSAMERTGVKIDGNLLAQQSLDLAKRISEIEQQAYQMAGKEFNLSSPKQLQEILFEQMAYLC